MQVRFLPRTQNKLKVYEVYEWQFINLTSGLFVWSMVENEIMTTQIAIFKGKKIRKTIHKNEWWFSVVDVAQALTDQLDDYTARKYWNKLAQRLREEGSEVVTFCHRLKLQAPDGGGISQKRY